MTKFLCWIFSNSFTSLMNSLSPCLEFSDSFFTATSWPFGINPCTKIYQIHYIGVIEQKLTETERHQLTCSQNSKLLASNHSTDTEYSKHDNWPRSYESNCLRELPITYAPSNIPICVSDTPGTCGNMYGTHHVASQLNYNIFYGGARWGTWWWYVVCNTYTIGW